MCVHAHLFPQERVRYNPDMTRQNKPIELSLMSDDQDQRTDVEKQLRSSGYSHAIGEWAYGPALNAWLYPIGGQISDEFNRPKTQKQCANAPKEAKKIFRVWQHNTLPALLKLYYPAGADIDPKVTWGMCMCVCVCVCVCV